MSSKELKELWETSSWVLCDRCVSQSVYVDADTADEWRC